MPSVPDWAAPRMDARNSACAALIIVCRGARPCSRHRAGAARDPAAPASAHSATAAPQIAAFRQCLACVVARCLLHRAGAARGPAAPASAHNAAAARLAMVLARAIGKGGPSTDSQQPLAVVRAPGLNQHCDCDPIQSSPAQSKPSFLYRRFVNFAASTLLDSRIN